LQRRKNRLTKQRRKRSKETWRGNRISLRFTVMFLYWQRLKGNKGIQEGGGIAAVIPDPC
jgi:hypothetical protein